MAWSPKSRILSKSTLFSSSLLFCGGTIFSVEFVDIGILALETTEDGGKMLPDSKGEEIIGTGTWKPDTNGEDVIVAEDWECCDERKMAVPEL